MFFSCNLEEVYHTPKLLNTAGESIGALFNKVFETEIRVIYCFGKRGDKKWKSVD